MLYILCQEETNRSRFIFDLIFNALLGVDFRFVHEASAVPEGSPLLNYSDTGSEGTLWIRPSRLLFETGIDDSIALDHRKVHELTIAGEDFFDPFASAFYLVSRYEEYQPFEPDAHGRFTADQSILFRSGLLQTPVVNLWARAIDRRLHEMFDAYSSKPREFSFQTTIDIDQAWKYRYKGFRRNMGGFIGDLFRADVYKLSERSRVLTGMSGDPFDNFDYQEKIHDRYNVKPIYFVQVGERSTYDKNLPVSNPQFAKLIRKLDQAGTVGMHPSYTSNAANKDLQDEYNDLTGVLGRAVTMSRQHFLVHYMPDTYRNISALGILEDHTMGYSTELGFRAGIAAPFYFYDLPAETATELRLVPFCMMDITPMHYYGLNVAESKKVVGELIRTVRECGGHFVTLWHNESLSDAQQWKGWRELYEFILAEATGASAETG